MKHAEAFCLMTYQSVDGSESEVLWNSRDGVTPFMIPSLNGAEMSHVNFQGDVRALDYVPNVGSRIFVDMTESRARILAAQQLEYFEQNESEWLYKTFESREAASQCFFEEIYQPGQPDILVVTAGYIDELLERRKGPSDGDNTMKPEPGDEPERAERSMYFDRQVRPISQEEWVRLSNDWDYKVLARTDITEDLFVSTIWMGLDHGFSMIDGDHPIIFETMTFRRLPVPRKGLGDHVHDFDEVSGGQERYGTEAEALAGHKRIVEKFTAVEQGTVVLIDEKEHLSGAKGVRKKKKRRGEN